MKKKIHLSNVNLESITAQWLTKDHGYEYMNAMPGTSLTAAVNKIVLMATTGELKSILVTGFTLRPEATTALSNAAEEFGVVLKIINKPWMDSDKNAPILRALCNWLNIYNDQKKEFVNAINDALRFNQENYISFWLGRAIIGVFNSANELSNFMLEDIEPDYKRRLIDEIYKLNDGLFDAAHIETSTMYLKKKALFGKTGPEHLMSRELPFLIRDFLRNELPVHTVTTDNGQQLNCLVVYNIEPWVINNLFDTVSRSLEGSDFTCRFNVIINVRTPCHESFELNFKTIGDVRSEELAIKFGQPKTTSWNSTVTIPRSTGFVSLEDFRIFVKDSIIPKLKGRSSD